MPFAPSTRWSSARGTREDSVSPSTYLTTTQLSALRRRLADELAIPWLEREAYLPAHAQDVAGDICRPDMGGAYLSNVQSRASVRGLRAELDAVVERMEVAS